MPRVEPVPAETPLQKYTRQVQEFEIVMVKLNTHRTIQAMAESVGHIEIAKLAEDAVMSLVDEAAQLRDEITEHRKTLFN